MYFVIYIIGAREHAIIPIHWVNNYKNMLEKSIKYAINPSQAHLCYYSTNIDENGRTDQQSNFRLPIKRAVPVDGECCFHVLLVHFFRE